MSIFDGEISKDAANKYGRSVEIDGKNQSLASGIRRATRSSAPTPIEAMRKEHAKLFDTFREHEGRDPVPHADPEFWQAYEEIMKFRGCSPADAEGEPVLKADATEPLPERLRKRLAEGPAEGEPPWIAAVIERSR